MSIGHRNGLRRGKQRKSVPVASPVVTAVELKAILDAEDIPGYEVAE
jgi:hypothetical protein